MAPRSGLGPSSRGLGAKALQTLDALAVSMRKVTRHKSFKTDDVVDLPRLCSGRGKGNDGTENVSPS